MSAGISCPAVGVSDVMTRPVCVAKCQIRHEPIFICSSFVKSDPAWMHALKFEANTNQTNRKIFLLSKHQSIDRPNGARRWKYLHIFVRYVRAFASWRWFFSITKCGVASCATQISCANKGQRLKNKSACALCQCSHSYRQYRHARDVPAQPWAGKVAVRTLWCVQSNSFSLLSFMWAGLA